MATICFRKVEQALPEDSQWRLIPFEHKYKSRMVMLETTDSKGVMHYVACNLRWGETFIIFNQDDHGVLSGNIACVDVKPDVLPEYIAMMCEVATPK